MNATTTTDSTTTAAIHVRVERELVDGLRRLARERDRSLSAELRRALQFHLARSERARGVRNG